MAAAAGRNGAVDGPGAGFGATFPTPMSSTDATQAMRQSAVVLCLGVPRGTQFGIDLASYTVAERFLGIKMIPPGPHIVSYVCVNEKFRASAPRVSLFLNLRSQEIRVFKWDPSSEALVKVSTQEQRQYATGVRRMDFDAGLAPYPSKLLPQWKNLTRNIDAEVVAQLAPVQDFTPHATPPVKGDTVKGDAVKSSAQDAAVATPTANSSEDAKEPQAGSVSGQDKEQAIDEKQSPASAPHTARLSSLVYRRRFYSAIPKPADPVHERKALQKRIQALVSKLRTLETKALELGPQRQSESLVAELRDTTAELKDAQGNMATRLAAISMRHHDQTPLLRALVSKSWSGRTGRLLGEIEFAFTKFMCGGSLAGLEQWKRLTRLCCTCDRGVNSQPEFFLGFTQTVTEQLKSLPEDLFVDAVSGDNFLRGCLRDYVEILTHSRLTSAHNAAFTKLSNLLREKFGQGLGGSSASPGSVLFDPDDEYAPTVVELPEEKLRSLTLED